MFTRYLDAKDQMKLVFLIAMALCIFGLSFGQTASYDAAQRAMVERARAAQAAASMASNDASSAAPVGTAPSAAPSVPGAPGA